MTQQLNSSVSSNRLFCFDFSQTAEITGGDTLAGTPVMACCPSGLTFATPSISGSTVRIRISGGTAGENYGVSCTVTTAAGSTIVGQGLLLILPDCGTS